MSIRTDDLIATIHPDTQALLETYGYAGPEISEARDGEPLFVYWHRHTRDCDQVVLKGSGWDHINNFLSPAEGIGRQSLAVYLAEIHEGIGV